MPLVERSAYLLLAVALLALGVAAIQTNHLLLFLGAVVFLSCALWFAQRTARVLDLRHPTIAGVWFWCFVAMNWVPSLLIYVGITPEGYSYPIFPGPHLHTFLIATGSILITALLGVWLANVLFHFRMTEIREYFEACTMMSPVRIHPYLILLLVALGSALLYLREVKELPLVDMLKDPGDYAYLAALRENSFVGLNSPFKYAFSVAREVVYPFLIAVGLGGYLHTRRRVWFVLFWVAITAGTLYAAASIARGPVATVMLVIICFWYLYKSGRIFSWRILVAAALLLSFPVLVTILTGSGSTLLDALRIVGIRIFYAPAYAAYVYFEVIPKEVDFQYGATIGKLAWLLGKTHFDMTQYALFTIYPEAPDTASAGGPFFADFYANWGLPGVWVGGMVIGMIMQAIQILLLRQRKTVVSLAVYAFMFYAFWMTTSRSLPTVLLSTGVSFVLLFWWLFIRADRRAAVSKERFRAKRVAYEQDSFAGGRA